MLKTDTRAVARRVAPALIVTCVPFVWVVQATRRASFTSLGRDQGIFQYIAWAVAHGARDYRDARDVNGPLSHMVHLVFLWLGGGVEHRFRVLDLTVSGAVFLLVGACLPSLARERPTTVQRLAWALAAWVVLSGQYLMYTFWDLAQRESFFDWFMLSSVALQVVSSERMQRVAASERRHTSVAASERRHTSVAASERRHTSVAASERRHEDKVQRALLMIAGALSIAPWFGKPTYALFTLAQVAVLMIDDAPVAMKKRLAPFALGAALGTLPFALYMFVYGDLGAFLRIYLFDVPAMYRFIWARTPSEIFSIKEYAELAALSCTTSFAMIGLVASGFMPRRALAIAAVPLAGLASVAIQGKGFPYHFHPVTAGLYFDWLAIIAWLAGRAHVDSARSDGDGATLAAYVAACVLAVRVGTLVPLSSHAQNFWIDSKARSREAMSGYDYLVYFRTEDFFPWELRQVAAFLRAHTRPNDRVQTYGMDPYVLFLAQRQSATPYIYAYDLNVDAALEGGTLPEDEGGLHPSDEQEKKIRAIRDAHERDLLERLERAPPAAFVFFDHAPLLTDPDARKDFEQHCPRAAAWVDENYVEAAVFEGDHVLLRKHMVDAGT